MKIVINDYVLKGFVFDDEGRLRSPMYFEKLSDNAKKLYRIMIESGDEEFSFEDVEKISQGRVNEIVSAVAELSENDYVTVLGFEE